MYEPRTEQSFEPTVLSAVWRYRWLVLFLALAFGGLGWYYGSSNEQWTAEGAIQVKDPQASNVFDQQGNDAQRYVQDQVAIVQSRNVARQAVELLDEQQPDMDVRLNDVVDGLSVSSGDDTNLITISFTGTTPEEAIGVVNAVIAAYQEVSQATAEATFNAAIAELDDSLATIDDELDALQQEIIEHRGSEVDREALELQLADARADLLAYEPPSLNASEEALARSIALLNALRARVDTLTAALAADPDDPILNNLLAQQTAAQNRLIDLQSRRDQIAVDADLAGSGVIGTSPAENAEEASIGLWVVLGAILGAVIASALAYLLAQRSRRFASRVEPERVFGVPLITDIPHFSQERLRTGLPVTDAPASAAAEAFRFVAAGITVSQVDRAGNGAALFKSVAITSAGIYDGKTTVAANTALAAAREGGRVLVVDADFASEALTGLLLGQVQRPLGMTDVAAGTLGLKDAVIRVTREYTGTVALLTRGTVDISGSDFFASTQAGALFEAAARDFDLILIDAPPLLRVAYATTIVRNADRALIVVAHGTDIGIAEEMRHRLAMIGTQAVGYVYNQAPLRAEMTLGVGSMASAYPAAPQQPQRR